MTNFEFDMHTAVFGISGSGKTYRCAQIFRDSAHKSIFINTQFRDYFEKIPISKTYDEMKSSLNSDLKTVWNTDNEKDIGRFMGMVEHSHRKGGFPPLYVYIDEADDFAGCYSRDADITRLATKLRNWNVYGIFLCQRTTGQLSRNIVGNCHELLLFTVHPGDFRILQSVYKIPKNPPLFYYYHYKSGIINYYNDYAELIVTNNIWDETAVEETAEKEGENNENDENQDILQEK